MIKVNIKNAVKEESIEKYAEKVKFIARKIEKHELPGSNFMGWKDVSRISNKKNIEDIKSEAKRLKKESVDLLVVIGIGGSYAGAKAGINMMQGIKPAKRDMEVIFAGNSMSSTDLAQKLSYAQHRNFAINVISKSGTTIETSIAFRLFRRLLEEKIGINNAKRFIVATTDANNGLLLKMALKNEWKKFVIPDNVGGRFSVLTPAGLFPMACAGLNIKKIISGFVIGEKLYSRENIFDNDAYIYAVARHILEKSKSIELMVQYEPCMAAFNEWWKQLAGETEGKAGKGLFPASAIFSTDLHSIGQWIQEGSKTLFETSIFFQQPKTDLQIFATVKNEDNLNKVSELTVHEINMMIQKSTLDAHVNVGRVPNIEISVGKMDEAHFGKIVTFFHRAVSMTAYLNEVNPFNQPGVEVYKLNLKNNLEKNKL